VCYLEDLFVAPSTRGHGVGTALIEWLRNAMRAEGWARVYWMTKSDNLPARRLYDRFTQADGFVRYVIRQK
jgi:GNAT superfamily N-acetyltransferase